MTDENFEEDLFADLYVRSKHRERVTLSLVVKLTLVTVTMITMPRRRAPALKHQQLAMLLPRQQRTKIQLPKVTTEAVITR